MNQLWYVVVVMVGAMLWSLWRVLARASNAGNDDRLKVNRAAFREREDEIKRQFMSGELTDDEHKRLNDENARQLISEVEHATSATKRGETRAVFVFMAVLLVVGSAALYGALGGYKPVKQWLDLQASAQSEQHQRSMEEMLLLLRTRLHHDPDDEEGWFMLGRTMMSLQQAELAQQAYARARTLAPNNPDIIVAYTQALRLADGDDNGAQIDRLLLQARLLSPAHEGALLMTAYRHFEKAEYHQAIPLFEQLKRGRAGDSEATAMLDDSIKRAEDGLRAQTSTTSESAQSSAVKAPNKVGEASTASLQVNVEVAASVLSSVPKNARVYIYAKAQNGSPAPLAVVTTTVDKLPIAVRLSDENAMNPAMKLSDHKAISVIARISLSGNANASRGDWQALVSLADWTKQDHARLIIQNQL